MRALSLSLPLSVCLAVYAGATNYSYNLACLITRASIYTVMILRRFMIGPRARPVWKCFLVLDIVVAVAASSPSRR